MSTFEARGRAIDGDTVAADFRLLGVDAFERRQLCQNRTGCWSCGKAAQDFAAAFLESGAASIALTPGESHGRPVATVSVARRDLGEALIRAGLASPQQYLRADRDRASRYAAAFASARRAKVGAMAGVWIEPAKWRGGER